jgi:hypothetical protein
MTNPELTFLRHLNALGVPFVIIGGHAIYAHGYRRNTEDLDLLWVRSPAAESGLLEALAAISAKWISDDIDPATGIERLVPVSEGFVRANRLMMLVTDLGFLDLFDYVPGCPDASVEQVIAESIDVDGLRLASLPWLRRMKEAAGRPKDRLDLEELDKLGPSAP